MKIKKLLCIILCLILPVIFFACKNDDETPNNQFDLKETQNFIEKTYTAQDEFFKALYSANDSNKDNVSIVGETLLAVSELLNNYEVLVAIKDNDGNSVIKQIDNGFNYSKNNEIIRVVMVDNTLFVEMKNKTTNVQLKVKYINNSNYAITIFDEQHLSSILVYFSGTTGRLKCNQHTSEVEDIFSLDDFSNFAKDDGIGEFLSNE